MSQDVVNVLKFVVDDDTTTGLSSANRNLKKNERAIQRVIEQQKKLTREAGKSADQIAIETLKRSDAKDEVIAQVMALQKERQAIMDAKSARTESINEVDKMIAAMKEQAATIGMSSSELAIHKATQKGATAEQLAAIQATQAEITAKKQASTATVNQVNSAEQMIQKLKQEIDLFGKSDDQILAYKLALDGATQAQIDEVMALRSKMAAMNKSLPIMQRMKQQLRFMRGGFGQVGHQIQDVAVQLQGGTDAMIVFGQQGSQIVSLFGPGGAALGALLAVGAAAFTVFKNFELTTNQVNELRQEFEKFTPKTEEGKEALAAATAILAQQERNNLRAEIELTTQKMGDAVTKAILAKQAFEATRAAMGDADETALEETIQSAGAEAFIAKGKIFGLRAELEALGGTAFDFPAQELFDQINELFGKPVFGDEGAPDFTPTIDTSEAEDAAEKFLDIERSFLTGIDKINSDFKLVEDDIKRVAAAAGVEGTRLNDLIEANEAARVAAVEAFRAKERELQNSHFTATLQRHIEHNKRKQELAEADAQREREIRQSTLDDFEASLEREEELLASQREMRQGNLDHMLEVMAREEAERAAIANRKKAINNALLDQANNLAAGFAAAVGKESKAYKALFAAQQALAVAQTIINTEAAAVAAQAPIAMGGLGPIAGTAMAAKIRAMGYASVALIAAQTAASFEGGGFTGRGSRSGGVDGRGGFPAILHPNETVIDHEGGGMQPVVVNQTINVTTGVQQTVRAEVANLLPQISEAAKAAVAEGRMRGGSYGTAMGI
jgi:hypothetical protein